MQWEKLWRFSRPNLLNLQKSQLLMREAVSCSQISFDNYFPWMMASRGEPNDDILCVRVCVCWGGGGRGDHAMPDLGENTFRWPLDKSKSMTILM